MQWTLLEMFLNELMRNLLSLDPGKESESVTSNIDVRDKIQIVLALAVLKKIDDKWFDELKAILDLVDNDLRSARNRYVHDLWSPDGATNKLKKLEFRTALKRPQSRKPLELTTLHETNVEPAEIWATADAITNAAAKIALLTQQHQLVTRRALTKKSP